MNKKVNQLLLTESPFMPLDIHMVVDLQKSKTEYKNLKKQEIHEIFMKTS